MLKQIPVECYSRVVGYFRPVNQANPGKQEEMRARKHFDANAYCKREFKGENYEVIA